MKKILLVDDLRVIVEKEKSILSRADFKIYTATSAEEAIRIHRQEQMDLIVADLDMPEMGGDSIARAVQTDGGLKKVAVLIVCTNRKADLERCVQAGASAYITKPIEPTEFFEKVSALLNVSERKSFRVLVKAQVEGKFMGIPFFCTSRDISATGILVEAEKSLVKGDRLICSFYLPTGQRIVAGAEVVRTMPESEGKFLYGLKFLSFEQGSSKEIESYISTAKR